MTAMLFKLLLGWMSSEQLFALFDKILENYKALTPEQLAALKKRFEDAGSG